MKTLMTDSPLAAAEIVRAGRLAAFPTETVYGLGADALNDDAVRRVYEVKGRPLDNPLIVHLADAAAIDAVAWVEMDFVRSLVQAFIPGPLTLVLKRRPMISDAVTAGLDTVAVRVPDHSLAQEFLVACGRPIAAPSANKSGRPSPTTWEAVREDFDGQIDCILRGPRSTIGLESTVVDCTSARPVLLREGAVTVKKLREVVDLAGPDSPSQAEQPAGVARLR
ncbi:MAG: threonylcarbamoyl-AMP synthase, partial [Rhodothermia bacterium]|nr:threonylcarbamoyl-AMP synthase [Rhodothermia bacterium]